MKLQNFIWSFSQKDPLCLSALLMPPGYFRAVNFSKPTGFPTQKKKNKLRLGDLQVVWSRNEINLDIKNLCQSSPLSLLALRCSLRRDDTFRETCGSLGSFLAAFFYANYCLRKLSRASVHFGLQEAKLN